MSDQDRIRDFIDTLVNVLGEVVNSRNILFHESLRDKLEAAWNDLLTNTIPQIRDDIPFAGDIKLQQAGLAGQQLDLKLQGFQSAYEDLKLMGGIKRLKRFFKWANLILGSLAAVIPAVELLKEYKGSAEIGVEEAEES
jgi:hypothetical protein